MSKLLLSIIVQQQIQLDLLYSQISTISLSSSQSSSIRDLTPLQRNFRDSQQISQIFIKQYNTEIIDNTDTRPTSLIRSSIRVGRNSLRTLKENRIKVLILVLSIILALILREMKWIGTLFSSL